ncbi:hypothetical protein SH2C18_32880 [Clostridium sediminicola]|uniref:hypothetical protein n=1 Tax=Clostridium sediminicola TaxID=3114879 RepID=UPI0031F1F0F1
MKFNVLFIKSKYILYFLILLLLLALSFIYMNINKDDNTVPTFQQYASEDFYEIDLNGDGKKDKLYIIKKENNYSLNVNTNLDSIVIKSNSKSDFFGEFCTYWPISINFQDLNRDNTPEILLQSKSNDKATQHIIAYDNETASFKDLISNDNNLLGILDLSNNKTPKLISGNISKNDMIIKSYILINNNFNEFTYANKSDENFFCKNLISIIINYLSTKDNPEELYQNIIKNHCSKEIDTKSLNTLTSLNSDKNNFIFQDAYFQDIKSNKEGYPTELEWNLSFRSSDDSQNKALVNYRYKINAILNEKDEFVINSFYAIN